jgi:hypothetical protein
VPRSGLVEGAEEIVLIAPSLPKMDVLGYRQHR